MKCYRVYPDARVEAGLPVQVFDNEGSVPVGGTHMSYIHAASALLLLEGQRIMRASADPYGDYTVMLEPERANDTTNALVLVPSSTAFRFVVHSGETYHVASHTRDRVSELIVMQPGCMIQAIMVPRTLGEKEFSFIFTYDGTEIRLAKE